MAIKEYKRYATEEYVNDIIPTEEEVMELLTELDIVQPMVDEDGAVLVDSDGKAFIL